MVGAPIRNRGWIINHWYNHLQIAAKNANLKPQIIFIGTPSDPTFKDAEFEFELIETDEELKPDQRVWDTERYVVMADLRNRLLARVREIGPELYLSLDSDVLLHPLALSNMLQGLNRFDAVAGLTFMVPYETRIPNFGWFKEGTEMFRRLDYTMDGLFPVTAIMANKLMKPAAYNVDYGFHEQGEDLKYSLNAAKAGIKLGADTRTVSKHVMSPDDLDKYDDRCGY